MYAYLKNINNIKQNMMVQKHKENLNNHEKFMQLQVH